MNGCQHHKKRFSVPMGDGKQETKFDRKCENCSHNGEDNICDTCTAWKHFKLKD